MKKKGLVTAGLGVLAVAASVWSVPTPVKTGVATPQQRSAAVKAAAVSEQIDWKQVEDQAVRDLQAFIRFDTTNPPGNEQAAAAWLAQRLREEGIAAEVVETAPGRFNVVGRFPGTGKARPLLIVTHMDVVPANEAEWRQPPFAGNVEGGMVWGRGAQDDKGPGIMALAAMAALVRAGVQLDRDVIFLAVADEETGGDVGIKLLLEARPELKQAEFALMVDGAFGLEMEGVKVLPVGVSEKASVALRISLEGTGGHSSLPLPDQTALERLTEAMQRLTEASQQPVLHDEVKVMLGRVGLHTGGAKGWLLQRLDWAPVQALLMPVLGKDPLLAGMTRRTVAWTGFTAGVKYNVYPSEAEAVVDVRILPGETPEQALEWVKRTLALPEATIELLEFKTPSRTDYRTPWFGLYEAVAEQRYPDFVVVPVLSPGATDGRHTRPAGIPTYVAVPAYAGRELLLTVHERDERIPVKALGEGARFLFEYLVAASVR